MLTEISFILNGKERRVTAEAGETLLHVLRDRLGLLGAKEACGQGECGACTVLIDGLPVTSCIYPFPKVEGRSVLTIEGLVANGELDMLQQSFIDAGAVQCGFCTPGMILSAKALLDRNPNPTEEETRRALSGNVCRCTGYTKIVAAVLLAAERKEAALHGDDAAF